MLTGNYNHTVFQSDQFKIQMCRLSYTLLAGALMVLAALFTESGCFTLHRFDNINDDRRDVSADAHHPATATGSDDEFTPSSQHQLFKRSATPAATALPAHQLQLTAAEWQQLLLEFQMIGPAHHVDSSSSSEERSLRPANVRGEIPSSIQQLDWDASDELEDDDDDSWKNVELLKKLFGNSWESVKDMQFAHTSTEDLIEDWISRLAWGERLSSSSSSGSAL